MQTLRRRLGLICFVGIAFAFVYFTTADTNFFVNHAASDLLQNSQILGEEREKSQKFGDFCPVNGSNSAIYNAATKIQMLDVYEEIPFDNYTLLPTGWLQGFSIKYDVEQIKKQPRLEVIVMPHSHCDPGWLSTFEGYYTQHTDSIHTGAMQFLNTHQNMSFIYAEMSFLEMWWRLHNETDRQAMKKVIDRGQLEIVTGGWVMTDEANSHYFATIMELMEGHECFLDYLPENHWSIDPFGLSPTLAYLIKSSGIKHMVIQRAHYAVKKYLAERKQLEFMWRQLWAGQDGDILTHLMPFDSYDLTKTCGPDPEVCCQFDFRRIGENCRAAGATPIKAIDQYNLEEKAVLLADQFRKKAQLYKESVVLVPHGEDFRYNTDMEWVQQHDNLGKLFEYINKNEERFNIRARFGTLKDYFKTLEKQLVETNDVLPTLSGDFFTYADRFDHYWSGYYTSRPFYKHMDRTIQHYVRTADILFSLANQKRQLSKNSVLNAGKEDDHSFFSMFTQLVDARRALSLFQHHDGVAGTAKDFVMQDYGDASAIASTKQIIEKSFDYLLDLSSSDSNGSNEQNILRINEDHFPEKLPLQSIIQLNSTLLLFNPLAFERKEVVCILISKSLSKIMSFDQSGEDDDQMVEVKNQQVHPVFELVDGALTGWSLDEPKFELCFMAKLPAIGFRKYFLTELNADEPDPVSLINISFKGQVNMGGFTQAKRLDTKEKLIEISNKFVTASFSSQSGYLRSMKRSSADKPTKVDLSFIVYGVRETSYDNASSGSTITSGAYLFMPDGPAKKLDQSRNSFVVLDGPIRKSVIVQQAGAIHMLHKVDLDIGSEALQIRNLVDMRQVTETEVGMHIDTSEAQQKPLDSFYTELNGYQMIRRRRLKKLPIQAHFYPMPGSAFIENDQKRVNLIGRQALGVASLEPGKVEVILDRRLNHDDGRGLEQGVLDNRLTESRFRLLFEQFTSRNPSKNTDYLDTATTSFNSLSAYHQSLELHYPVVTMFSGASLNTVPSSSFIKRPFPCDIHLVTLRSSSQPTEYASAGEKAANKKSTTLARPSAALILHRLGVECRLPLSKESPVHRNCAFDSDGKISIDSLFVNGPLNRVANATLTLLKVDQVVDEELKLKPMEIKTWQLDF
uniref:Alpha-mannosidase n=1 Tax=Ditylenchus dipsaci TaxID=166011 RepID=A0A915DEW7_9BILA